MFYCDNITKSYSSQNVLKSFSYSFPETGFVLLLGESGSGKTTLLNILAGLTPLDGGNIYFNNISYTSPQIKQELEMIGYVVQDSFFVDYLTVFDNLSLVTNDTEKIRKIIEKFGLTDCLYKYPSKLSGGEKQRISIIRVLLQNKKVLLLDEPTASLDYENKIRVFELLSELKKEMLIICSSHDTTAKKFADEIIDFNDLKNQNLIHREKPIYKKLDYTANEKKELFAFIKQWFRSFEKSKSTAIRITAIMILTILAVCLGDIPKHKLDSNAEYTYKLNQLQVVCDKSSEHLIKELENDNKVKEVVLNYSANVPDGIDRTNEYDISPSVTYNLTAHTLPFDSEAFNLSDKLAYGSYFTKYDQIILTMAEAKRLGEPSDLIGSHYTIEMYGGKVNFEIVGIFEDFTKYEIEYLRASGINLAEDPNNWIETYFINNKFVEQYMDDESFYISGKRTYAVYFSSFDSMKDFYDKTATEYKDNVVFIYANINPAIEFMFEYLFYIFFPAAIVIILVSICSYFQVLKTEIVHNSNSFSVYKYCGYELSQIKNSWLKANFIHIGKMLITSFATALLIMFLFNTINYFALIIPFQVFTFNLIPLSIFASLIILTTILVSIKSIKSIKIKGWNQMLLTQRDLL